MSIQFSPKNFSHFLKFWLFLLVLSGIGVWVFTPNRDSSAQAEPIAIDATASVVPTIFPPRIAEVIPSEGATEVLLGIEDPIVVRFQSSVKSYYIHFELDPQVEVLYENNPEKTEFRLLPKEPLQDGIRYTLKVSYVPREAPDVSYKPLIETSFTTQRTTTVVPLDAVPTNVIARRTEGKYIDVDIGSQTMVLFQDGQAVKQFLVSSGKRGMDTPKGEFSVKNKALRPWSKTYGLYMPYWMAFTADGKFGIHELPEWPGGYKEGANHLGRPVSHGCIRLGVGNAKFVYEWADIGTVLIVH